MSNPLRLLVNAADTVSPIVPRDHSTLLPPSSRLNRSAITEAEQVQPMMDVVQSSDFHLTVFASALTSAALAVSTTNVETTPDV